MQHCTAGDRTIPRPLPPPPMQCWVVWCAFLSSPNRGGASALVRAVRQHCMGGGGESYVAGCTPATDITILIISQVRDDVLNHFKRRPNVVRTTKESHSPYSDEIPSLLSCLPLV